MPVPRFRMGRLLVRPDFLQAVPRSAMIAAIVRHFTTQPKYDGQTIRTDHEHCCIRFIVETHTDRQSTIIRLEQP